MKEQEAMAKDVFMWLNEGEDEAVSMCGSFRLVRDYEGGGPAVLFTQEEAMVRDTCRTCKYYDVFDVDRSGTAETFWGECRRYPPKVYAQLLCDKCDGEPKCKQCGAMLTEIEYLGNAKMGLPLVGDNDRCGEYVQREIVTSD